MVNTHSKFDGRKATERHLSGRKSDFFWQKIRFCMSDWSKLADRQFICRWQEAEQLKWNPKLGPSH